MAVSSAQVTIPNPNQLYSLKALLVGAGAYAKFSPNVRTLNIEADPTNLSAVVKVVGDSGVGGLALWKGDVYRDSADYSNICIDTYYLISDTGGAKVNVFCEVA